MQTEYSELWRLPLRSCVLFVLASVNLVFADARQVNDFQWEGVDRIVAIGDVHGDYDNYLATLEAAGLVNKKGKWNGGKTHLVQTGDIPDRGPDTDRIIEHLTKLQKQAKKKGGQVHSLMGNHEAMNLYGDLRYVHDGEFKAFATRNSAALRDRYFELSMQDLQARDPAAFAALPENHREQWQVKHPLGWVEHRQAWDPQWNPEGRFAQWVLDRKVAIRVNDTVFLHGGISGFYCQNSLESITELVISDLNSKDRSQLRVVEDEFGPLWYRGLSGVEPEAPLETVEAILERHGAKRIVVGHTPTNGVIWPRYDARVLQIDTGISKHYGGYVAYLEITPEGLFAGYPGGKLAVPSSDQDLIAYLEQVIAMNPGNAHLQNRLQRLRQPPAPVPAEVDDVEGEEATQPEDSPEPMPICGISQ